MSEAPRHIPDWLLERLLLEDLPPGELAQLRARVEADAEARQRLQSLVESNRVILREHPPVDQARAIRARLASEGPRPARPARYRWTWAMAPALAAALALIVLRTGELGDVEVPPPAGVELTRIKGLTPHLLLHRQSGEQAEPLIDGDRAARGDRLQISYVAAGRAHGVILSIDGNGVITRHLPDQGDQAADLQAEGEVALGFSYQLDDAPGFERFFLITAAEPFSLVEVLEAARRLAADAGAAEAPLALPEGLEQRSLLLHKGPQ